MPPDPLCDTFELHYYSLLNTSPNLDMFTLGLSPLPFAKSGQVQNRSRLLIFHSALSLPHKNLLFQKFLLTSLHVICGLGPLPIKNPGYGYAYGSRPFH